MTVVQSPLQWSRAFGVSPSAGKSEIMQDFTGVVFANCSPPAILQAFAVACNVRNSVSLRHSSRSLPLRLLMKPFCWGFTGATQCQ